MQQKEETFQVIIDVIKNSTCFKAFTISADVPEIFMQQSWYTIKKVKDSYSYEFLLANKKCIVDVDVFRKILDICPRVEVEEFTEVQDDDATLTFLIDLGYKGPLHKYTNMCGSHESAMENTGSNYQQVENIDYPELIWEDFAFQIDHRKERKSRRKVSQRKKTADTHVADVDVSEESNPEPTRKKTASRRVVKKKVTISTADNIIPGPYVALELGKFISLTEAAEEEAARQVHATHASIMTKFILEPARRRPSGITIRDTSQNKKLLILSKLSKKAGKPAEDSQVLKAQVKELILYQGFLMSPQSSLPPQVKELGSKQESKYSEEDQCDDEEDDWIYSDKDDEKKDDPDDDKSIDIEMTDDEETNDELVQGEEQVNDDEDEGMSNAEVEDSRKGDAEISDVAEADVKKTKEVKDDAKKAELPPTSSSLFVSLGFGDQFLKLSYDTSLISTVKDTIDIEINSLLEVKIQSEVPHI
ncbi:hypothetical protein Tco_0316346 [Tanacetum coccineum]